MCVNYPIQREALENSVDKRYNVRSVLCLRFVSSKMCQKICTKITNKRSAYFEASRKRIMSLIDDWVCLLHYTPHSGGSKSVRFGLDGIGSAEMWESLGSSPPNSFFDC